MRVQIGKAIGSKLFGSAGIAVIALGLALARCGGDSGAARFVGGTSDGGTLGDGGLPGADGGSDAGTGDGGGIDGGLTDGGLTDGGTTDGGLTDGGTTDGGTADGGADGGIAGPPPPVLGPPIPGNAIQYPAPNIISASMDEGGNLWAVSSTTLYVLRAGAGSFEAYPNGQGDVGTATCSNNSPCQNAGLLSVAGGAAGEAWLGYRGIYFNGTEQDDPSVPLGIRESGGAERFHLTATGIARDRGIGQACGTSLTASGQPPPPVPLPDGHVVFCTPPGVLGNEPTGRWKMRFIWTIAYNHGRNPLAPAAAGAVGFPGDVFFGGNHGMAVWNSRLAPPFQRQEHQHSGWNYSFIDANGNWQTSLLCGDHHGVAVDPWTGNVWAGADFGVARLHYMDGFQLGGAAAGDFFGQNMSSYAAAHPDKGYTEPGNPDVPDFYRAYGFRTWGCSSGVTTCRNLSQDPTDPKYGGRDYVQSLSFDAYGNLWVASILNGVARVPIVPGGDASRIDGASTQADVQFWNWNRGGLQPGWTQQLYDYVLAVQGDPDGSLWVGTDSRNGGSAAYRFVASTGQWVSYGSVVPGQAVSQISLDPRPVCAGTLSPPACVVGRAVYFATDKGVTVYTGP